MTWKAPIVTSFAHGLLAVVTTTVVALAVACGGKSSDDSGGSGASRSDAGDGAGVAGSDEGSAGRGGSSAVAGRAGFGGAGGAGGRGASGATAGASGASADAGNGGAGGDGGGRGDLPQIGGCDVFSSDDAWNRDVSDEPVDDAWTERLLRLVGDVELHPDYGNFEDEHYGIPINVVAESQPALPIEFDGYPEESDPGPYPFPDPADAIIEGGTPEACDGDCHLLAVQRGSCMLYEGYACSYEGGWRCANGAVWNLAQNGYGQREKGWTSADAAGLAIAPGLVRYDEVQAGEMRHAIRFTVECTRESYVAPATHFAVPGGCDASAADSPPMGLRVRLRADYDLSGLSTSAQVVARAMQRYGMILADNGSNFYFQGEQHLDWSEDDVEPLKTIPASAFEVIAPPPLEP